MPGQPFDVAAVPGQYLGRECPRYRNDGQLWVAGKARAKIVADRCRCLQLTANVPTTFEWQVRVWPPVARIDCPVPETGPIDSRCN